MSSITPARVLARAKAFKGPLALGAPKLQCGKYKDAPAICNDMFQAFTYEGKFQFKRASGWIGPLARADVAPTTIPSDGAGRLAGPVALILAKRT